MKAAFQGVPGAYSQLACRKLLGENCKTLALDSFEQVFSAVEKGLAQRGVIPIENSLAGSIHQNYDLLMHHRLHIIGELYLRVEHCLLCHPSTDLRKLTQVQSHPQALAQCSQFFRKHHNVRPVAFFDTAGAAKTIAETAPNDTGAIASAYAAELYGLKILRRNLENQKHNYTRFLLISRKPSRPAGAGRKCSIAFTPARDQAGILFRILGVFALRDIDLLKIESRPQPEAAFAYCFYVDLEGAPGDAKVDRALEHLKEMAGQVRVLGAYSADEAFHLGRAGT